MSRRFTGFVALVGFGGLVVGLFVGYAAPGADAAGGSTPPAHVDTWAWCGVNPDDPVAAVVVRTFAQAAGIDATFGPCNIPTEGYTPANTTNRYVSADVYMRLVQLNATVGMKTVVYDKRLWDPSAGVRSAAINFWLPEVANIAAWDMGDEFDPANVVEWNTLKDRWAIVRGDAQARTGVRPFTNMLSSTTVLDKALSDLPGVSELLSFAVYGGDHGASFARAYASRAKLMCAVNEFDHSGYVTTAETIRTAMDELITAGCDQLLVFGGFPVYDDPAGVFGASSIVDRSGATTARAAGTQEGSGHSALVAMGPVRLLETRSDAGPGTVDGRFNGIGMRPADSALALGIVGRANIADSVESVVLNVTVTESLGAGYLTVYPCGAARPITSNLNYDVGVTRAVAVIARVGAQGRVCVYTQAPTHVIVDLAGYYPIGASFSGIQPARLLDTRVGPEFTTIDGFALGQGRILAGSTTHVKVAERGGVPVDASSVDVNITAVNTSQAGYLTVYPCGEQLSLASTLNFGVGVIVSNSAVVAVGTNGSICIFSSVETDVLVDVNGYGATLPSARIFAPVRALETRAGLATADGLAQGSGRRPNNSVLELQIGGRFGVPQAVRAAVLNITVTEATGPGFVTVYPCGAERPVASTLNYVRGVTVANLAIAATSAAGTVCIYTQTAAHLVVDFSGYHT